MNTLDRIVLSLMFLTFLTEFRDIQGFVLGLLVACLWVGLGAWADREEGERI